MTGRSSESAVPGSRATTGRATSLIPPNPPTPLFRRGIIFSCVAYYLIAGFGIASTKATFGDEGWFTGIAYRFATTGHMGSPTMSPWGFSSWLPQVRDYTYWVLPGYFLFLTPWIKAVGCTLLTARTLSLIFGLVLILVWYRLIFTLTQRQDIALLALVLGSVDLMTIVRCSQARMDSLSVLTTFAAFLVYLSQREKSPSRALFLGNLLAAFGMMVHPNGVFGVAGMALLAFYDRKSLNLKRIACFVSPYLIIGCAYAFYVLQAPDVWRQQLGGHAADRAGGLWHPLSAIANELRGRYFTSFGFSPNASASRKLLILTLVPYWLAPLVCLFSSRIRKLPGMGFLLSMFLVIQIYFTFFEGTKYYAYLLHIMPYYTCFVAIAAMHFMRQYVKWRSTIIVALVGLILFQIGGAFMMIRQNLAFNVYREISRRMDVPALIARGETVMASSEFGFYFGFDRVRDDRSLSYVTTAQPLYAIIPVDPPSRMREEAEKWAPLVDATLRNCYSAPEEIGGYRLYRRNDSCAKIAVREDADERTQ